MVDKPSGLCYNRLRRSPPPAPPAADEPENVSKKFTDTAQREWGR